MDQVAYVGDLDNFNSAVTQCLDAAAFCEQERFS